MIASMKKPEAWRPAVSGDAIVNDWGHTVRHVDDWYFAAQQDTCTVAMSPQGAYNMLTRGIKSNAEWELRHVSEIETEGLV
jgi:hypothetical protein